MYRPPRSREWADDFNELVQALSGELRRHGLTPFAWSLVGAFGPLGERLEFNESIEDYRESLRHIDPFGRRGCDMRRGLETSYQIALPALPGPLPALGDGE